MIRKIEIANFKSVKKLELELGRVTVLIGENGAGKSNILEAIAFAGAAAADKVANEFLAPRGIRVPEEPRFMMSAFSSDEEPFEIVVSAVDEFGQRETFAMRYAVKSYGDLRSGRLAANPESDFFGANLTVDEITLRLNDRLRKQWLQFLADQPDEIKAAMGSYKDLRPEIERFIIYAPENRELRTFAEEGQIFPLGIRGEGLFRLLKILSQQDEGAKLVTLKEKLQLIDWFEDFEFQQDAMAYERRLLIRDRHLSDDLAYFDQRSANEGFLFLLFYFCLFLSDATPPFFAIDNIDASLNPRLCVQLMRELVKMAADNGKQAIVTTHNPAVLDGLDLSDDEQRLYVVRRNIDGETIVSRIHPPKVAEGRTSVPLSEAFLRGYLGGLPNNF